MSRVLVFISLISFSFWHFGAGAEAKLDACRTAIALAAGTAVGTAAFVGPTIYTNAQSTAFREPSSQQWKDWNRINGGRLTPLWALEAIGGDLARQRINAKDDTYLVPIAVFDTGIKAEEVNPDAFSPDFVRFEPAVMSWAPGERHGTAVANLIVDPVFGISPVVRISQDLAYYSDSGVFSQSDIFLADDVLASDLPFLVSSSAGSAPFVNGIWAHYAAKDIPVFVPAGNLRNSPYSFGGVIDRTTGAHIVDQNEELIVVGSLDPNGSRSWFSKPGEGVDVYAAADSSIISRSSGLPRYTPSEGSSNELNFFSGTSAAQPLVAGAVANVMGLVGRLSSKEVDLLIKSSKLSNGSINAFRLVLVGEELKRRGFEQLSQSERLDLIEESKNFQFKEIAQGFEAAAAGKSGEEKVDLLRQAFFSQPTAERARHLAEKYAALGLSTNARYYDGIASQMSGQPTPQ